MLSAALFYVFKFTFKLVSTLTLVPFTYDFRRNRLASPAKVSLAHRIISGLAFFLFCVKAVFSLWVILRLGILSDWVENVSFLPLTGFSFLIYWNNARFLYNLWRKRRRVTWTFNQISKFRESVPLRQKSTFAEKNMLTWIPGHVNIVFTLLMEFFHNPTSELHLFSSFGLLQGTLSYSMAYLAYAVLEAFTLSAFICTSLFEFSLQTYVLKGLICWTKSLRREKAGNYALRTFKSYKKCQLTVEAFNDIYGINIEQIKSTFSACCTLCNYLMIRWPHTLSAHIKGFILTCIGFCHTLPPLLYNNAFEIHENSWGCRKVLVRARNCWRSAYRRTLLRKCIPSLRPMKITVGSIYFLDRTMTPLFLWIIFNYTCTLLLSF